MTVFEQRRKHLEIDPNTNRNAAPPAARPSVRPSKAVHNRVSRATRIVDFVGVRVHACVSRSFFATVFVRPASTLGESSEADKRLRLRFASVHLATGYKVFIMVYSAICVTRYPNFLSSPLLSSPLVSSLLSPLLSFSPVPTWWLVVPLSASMARQEAVLGKEEMTKRMQIQQVTHPPTALETCWLLLMRM